MASGVWKWQAIQGQNQVSVTRSAPKLRQTWMNFGACIMTINWKSGIWVALLTAVLSACGGGKESNSTTAPPPVVVPPVVTLQSVAVIPANVTLVVGGKQTFSVTGAYSDGTTKALTTGLTWSANGTTVSVDAVTGEATARAVGAGAVT
jgi:hypothetical protein